VLGYAWIARAFVLPAIGRAGNSELYGVASRDAAKLAEARLHFPTLKQTYGDYAALLRDPEIDAVYIPLPNNLHCEWTIRAAEAGKHVLCEKPIALNAAEARRMVDATTAHGVKLMEAFMFRHAARVRQVLEVLRSGALGEPRFLSASFRFPLTDDASIRWQPELGGGSLYDVGCYPVNFAGLVADTVAGGPGLARPDSVAVECVRARGVDRSFSALLRYPSGLIASLHSGFDSNRLAAEIIGTEGLLEIPDAFWDSPGSLWLTHGGERREIAVGPSDGFQAEVENFADAIRKGSALSLGLEETLRNAEVIDRLYAAAR
jgi:predicted dehydrogenase